MFCSQFKQISFTYQFVLFIIVFSSFSELISSQIINQTIPNPTKTIEQLPFRLSNSIQPLEYNIDLETNIHRGEFDFYGFVNIKFIVVENNTSHIILNANQLNNISVNLIDLKNGESYENLNYDYDNVAMLIIYANNQLHVNTEYLLRISYRGVLNEEPYGFYRSHYLDDKNRKVWVAATQFQPFYARKAFPCYDEPSFKAKFTLTLTHGSNYTALSNMPADNIPISFDRYMKTTKFMQTPLMSTYTLAFVLSNFDSIVNVNNMKIHRVHTPSSNQHQPKTDKGQFALQVSIKSLIEYEKFLNLSYPLDKIDHIVLPINSGLAMENWGLLTYAQENFLIYDTDFENNNNNNNINENSYGKLKSLILINHEIGHQWFGNLVTPNWWNCTWLSEGFSTFYSYDISNKIYPKWNIKDFQIFDMSDPGYYLLDDNDLPLIKSIESEADIKSAFQLSSYYKAANVLQMFRHALTPETFRKGVILYLNKFKYSTVNETDLFACFQLAAKNDSIQFFKDDTGVEKSMKPWLLQSGYPILTVTRNYDTESFTIHQEPFDHDFDELWWIPINFATSKEPYFQDTQTEYFLPRVRSITINPAIGKLKIAKSDWLLLNNQQTGYYITNYDEHNWRLIAKTLRRHKTIIHEYNKAQIFRDLNLLFGKDMISIGIILDVLRYLDSETDLTAWNSAAQLLKHLNWKLEGRAIQEEFHTFVRKLIEPFFNQIGCNEMNDESPYWDYVRMNIFDLACSVGLSQCLKCAKTELQDFIDNNRDIQPNYLKRSILCYSLKEADENLFKIIHSKLFNSTKLAERDDLIFGLSCTTNYELNAFLLETITNDNSNRFNQLEKSKALYYTYFYNKTYRNMILKFLRKNYTKFLNLPKDMLEIFRQTYMSRHPSENKRTYKSIKRFNKYATNVIENIQGCRYKESYYSFIEERLSEKTEDDIYFWLTTFANNTEYTFSSSGSIHSVQFFAFIIEFIKFIWKLVLI